MSRKELAMTDLASPTLTTRGRFLPAAALVLALSSVAVWLLAGIVDDALYAVSAAGGAVAAAAGWRTRKDRTGAKSTVALVAMIVGGLLAAEVIVFTIAWVIYHAV
jgi:hypothetical protein